MAPRVTPPVESPKKIRTRLADQVKEVEPSSYLSDSSGRQITPLARTHGLPDPLPPNSGPSPTRAYHRAHGNVTEHQKSQAELNSQVATREVAGVFIERNDMNAKENQTAEMTPSDTNTGGVKQR